MSSYDHTIFLDESGEPSFSEASCYQHFAITTLTLSNEDCKKMGKAINRFKGKLYKLGWPKKIEIKASVLHNIRRMSILPLTVQQLDGDKFITDLLVSLCQSCLLEIDYIVIRKAGMISPSFRSAPAGIAYNFFAGKVLSRPVEKSGNCLIIPDKRNKETHSNKPFREYILTTLHGEALETQRILTVAINPQDSHSNPGLQAVDYFSWAVYRAYEHKDNRFIKLFSKQIQSGARWYC